MERQLIDIGINLMHRSFAYDREKVMARAYHTGVTPLIITGTSERSSREAADYASKYPGKLYSTAGVHPHDAKGCGDGTIEALRMLCGLAQVVAVGECGLDYDRDFSPRDIQRKWFEAQISLAEELDMPLFLHERAAFHDFRAIMARHSGVCVRSVVHCFTGTREELEAYLALGCYIGITGWICDERRGTGIRELLRYIPDDRLMIETDAPFLAPRNMPRIHGGDRNEPQYLRHIAKEAAKCRGEEEAQLALKTTENAKRFFGLE